MARHAVALTVLPDAMKVRESWERLAGVVDELTPIDETTGLLEARVEAGDFEGALQKVWDAIAAAGVDDDFAFAEHPSIPGHWRRRGVDGPPGALA
jgi:hypothetical protein